MIQLRKFSLTLIIFFTFHLFIASDSQASDDIFDDLKLKQENFPNRFEGSRLLISMGSDVYADRPHAFIEKANRFCAVPIHFEEINTYMGKRLISFRNGMNIATKEDYGIIHSTLDHYHTFADLTDPTLQDLRMNQWGITLQVLREFSKRYYTGEMVIPSFLTLSYLHDSQEKEKYDHLQDNFSRMMLHYAQAQPDKELLYNLADQDSKLFTKDNFASFYQEAVALRKLNSFSQGRTFFERVLSAHDKILVVKALHNLGSVSHSFRHYDDAVQWFLKANALHKEFTNEDFAPSKANLETLKQIISARDTATKVPTQVWSEIFKYLDKKDLFQQFYVNKIFNYAAKSPFLWRDIPIEKRAYHDIPLILEKMPEYVQSLVLRTNLDNKSALPVFLLKHLQSIEIDTGQSNAHFTLKGLGELKNLQTLRITFPYRYGDGSGSIEGGIKSLASLINLEELSLLNCLLEDDDCQSMTAFPHLTRLALCESNVTAQGAAYLSNLKQLETLDLSDNLLLGEGIKPLLSLKNLKTLRLVNSGHLVDDWEEELEIFKEQLPNTQVVFW